MRGATLPLKVTLAVTVVLQAPQTMGAVAVAATLILLVKMVAALAVAVQPTVL
jgi:hypothetical protein